MSAKRLLAILAVAALVMLAVGAGPQVRGNAPPTFQAPDANAATIPYSGTLTDGTGQPVPDGAYTFAFTLYGAETDGEPLWTETQEGVTVKGGVFVALLGSTNAIPQGTLDGGELWLAVAVRGPGETEFTALAPRQRVSAVSAAVSPGTAGTQACPHNHWGETWTGTGNGLVLYGNSDNYATLYASDDSPNGGFGLYGRSAKGVGVYGRATGPAGKGVYGHATALSGTTYGVYGQSASGDGTGVFGYATATSGTNYGVYGKSNSNKGGCGVYGYASAASVAAYGDTYGVYGRNDSVPTGSLSYAYGVYGIATATSGSTYGVLGLSESTDGLGVFGVASATSGKNYGVAGRSDSPDGYGVYGLTNVGGYAGYFRGKVRVTGYLEKAGGGFKIDHPLDPANKYLNHSFVESPDMKNMYDGVVILDANGEAVVQLPAWFGALNRDFRYQLTCIGGYAPVYIAEEIHDNQFKIAGGRPGLKVSWQVTGIRQDPWANEHRITVEEYKSPDERGKYLHPEEYGMPETVGIDYDRMLLQPVEWEARR